VDPRSLRVYVVTSKGFVPGRSHRDVSEAALAGGATAVQLRASELTDTRLEPLAGELAERCRAAGALFVVNDRVPVAAAVRAGSTSRYRDSTGGGANRNKLVSHPLRSPAARPKAIAVST